MKTAVVQRTVTALLLCLPLLSFASDPLYEQFFNGEPSYNIVKEAFVKQYGSEKSGWPIFIIETEKLNKQFLEFNSQQKNPNTPNFALFFNNCMALGTDETNRYSFEANHKNSHRSYYSIFRYLYGGLTDWDAIRKSENPAPVPKTYFLAAQSEGVLPVILFKYASMCPQRMLDWYFREIFPVIDLLYRQQSREELLKVLESIGNHINKLTANNDFCKAEIWYKSVNKFVNYYRLENLLPKVPSDFFWLKNYLANVHKEKERAVKEFDKVFSHRVRNDLSDYFINLIYPYKGVDYKTIGKLIFPQTPEQPGKNIYPQDYRSKFVVGKIEFDKDFLKEYFKKREEVLLPELNENQLIFETSTIKSEHSAFLKSAKIFKETKKTLFMHHSESNIQNNNIDATGAFIAGDQEWFIAYEDLSSSSLTIIYKSPHLNYCSLRTSMYGEHIPIPTQDKKYLKERLNHFFTQSAEEVLNKLPIPPQIYGMVYENSDNPKYALKVTSSAKEVKPDGKATVTVSAQLYSYIETLENSGKPIQNKVISAEIIKSDEITPGLLSSFSSETDVNGKVNFIYTAPTIETLDKMKPHNRIGAAVKLMCKELGVEDVAYLKFLSDNGKIWADPGFGVLPDTAFIPPDKRYPALISANFFDDNMEPLANAEVFFSISGDNPSGLLRNKQGSEGKQISAITDVNGLASVHYYYSKTDPPSTRLTETVEARSQNMSTPFRAYVTVGFNVIIDNAISGYEGKGEVNAGENIPLKINLKDEWNPGADLEGLMSYWGAEESSGVHKLFVKLEIEKQGLVPGYMMDMIGEKSYPEPSFKELLWPKSFPGEKNLLYIPHYSVNKEGLPFVRPLFSGTNNYEIRIALVDENGVDIFKRAHPRRSALISVPTGIPAESFMVWFASNPLGPHTPLSRFARLLLSTVSLGKYGGFGAILSLADAAFAINSGNTEELVTIMLSEIKGKYSGEVADKGGLSGELINLYDNIAITEQYVSFGITSYADLNLVSQMESRILTEVARAGINSAQSIKMVVLVGEGSQKLFMEHKPESKQSNFKISITGIDKKTSDFFEKLGGKANEKGKYIEIPVAEGKFTHDEQLNTYSLKNGNVSVYILPGGTVTTSENAVSTKVF